MSEPGFLALALAEGTPKAAAKAAFVVGALLTAINQGDLILAGELPVLWKVALTYCVPYCVATWGAVSAKPRMRVAPATSGAAPSSS